MGQDTSGDEEKYKSLLGEKELQIEDLQKRLADSNAEIDEARSSLLRYKVRYLAY